MCCCLIFFFFFFRKHDPGLQKVFVSSCIKCPPTVFVSNIFMFLNVNKFFLSFVHMHDSILITGRADIF